MTAKFNIKVIFSLGKNYVVAGGDVLTGSLQKGMGIFIEQELLIISKVERFKIEAMGASIIGLLFEYKNENQRSDLLSKLARSNKIVTVVER